MKLKIEGLKRSERGIEVIGYVPTPDRDRVIQPNIPYRWDNEERERLLASYYSDRKAANEKYDVANREYERLHLGDAGLVQAEAEIKDAE